jgi:integrase
MARGRKPSVGYWPSRTPAGYYTTIRSDQVLLAAGPDDKSVGGPTYLEALKRFAVEMARRHAGPGDTPTVALAFALFRDSLDLMDKEYDIGRRGRFDSSTSLFEAMYPDLPVSKLLPEHFYAWWKGRGWGPTTTFSNTRWVIRALVGACRARNLPPPPLKNLQIPRPVSRGKEARLDAELCRLLIAAPQAESFRLFQRALWATGARPVELSHAEEKHYAGGAIVFRSNARGKGEYRHKTAQGGKGPDRVINFPPEMVTELEALCAKYPDGPLFRTPRGKAWSRNTICLHWKRVLSCPAVKDYMRRKRIDPAQVTPYCYRHTFLTEWIEAGRGAEVAARLCGTSVEKVLKVYGHPDDSRMRDHFLAFSASDRGRL